MIETYIPLYRKYRPQQFSDLVGQEIVSTALGNAINLGKITHAYLFCGPRGTGKTSAARIFAKSLNCVQGPTLTPCQTCPSCMAITNGNALDVTEIDAASNNGVDNIRELTDKVQFSPIEGKFKIYIIDEVHMLSPQAFNALLKTLEEPPPNVVFVFATTEAHKVLPTIISRCQRFDFSRITRSQIEARLNQVAQWENIQISPEAVTLIARHVKGGLRDALGLLDQVSVLGKAGVGQVIQPQDVRAFIGVLEEELLLDMTQGILERNPEAILSQISCLQERGVEPAQMTRELVQHFRNLLLAKTCGPSASPELLETSPEFYQKLCQQAEGFEIAEIPQILSRLSTMESQLKHSQQPLLWLEIGLLDIAYRQDILLVKELADRVADLEARLQSGVLPPAQRQPQTHRPVSQPALQPVATAPMPQPRPEPHRQPEPIPARPVAPNPQAIQQQAPIEMAPASVGAAMTGDLNQFWQQVLQVLTHNLTKSLVKDHFRILEITDNAVTVGYASDTIYDTFKRSPDKPAYLEKAIETVLGKPYKVNYQLSQAPPQPLPQRQAPREPMPAPVSAPISAQPVMMPPIETVSQVSPKYDALPEIPPVQNPVSAEINIPLSPEEEEVDIEMQQAKKYTQELLLGRLIE